MRCSQILKEREAAERFRANCTTNESVQASEKKVRLFTLVLCSWATCCVTSARIESSGRLGRAGCPLAPGWAGLRASSPPLIASWHVVEQVTCCLSLCYHHLSSFCEAWHVIPLHTKPWTAC